MKKTNNLDIEISRLTGQLMQKDLEVKALERKEVKLKEWINEQKSGLYEKAVLEKNKKQSDIHFGACAAYVKTLNFIKNQK